jgi:hypothetical protein
VHGDGQYAPEALQSLLDPLIQKKLIAFLDSRMSKGLEALRGGMPLYKFAGNKILTTIQNQLSGLNLTEYHSGYRLYSVDALRNILSPPSPTTGISTLKFCSHLPNVATASSNAQSLTYYGDEICHVNGIPTPHTA